MAASNRSKLINKTFQVLKKHYVPCRPPEDRSLLEHLLYACVLEDAHFDTADEAFARLQQVFFDWNEVRVTSIAELAEVLAALPIPSAAAMRLKQSLQHVFEANYSFDIEPLRKLNQGKAIKELEKINGVSSFTIAYVVQHGLGGHSIPTSKSAIDVLETLGVLSSAEAKKGRVPGLERAVPKSKGIEFGSLLHQFATDYLVAPNSSKVQAIIQEIVPRGKTRVPDRGAKRAGGKAKPQTEAKRSKKKGTKSSSKGKVSPKKKSTSTGSKKKKTTSKKKGTPGKASSTKRLSKRKPR